MPLTWMLVFAAGIGIAAFRKGKVKGAKIGRRCIVLEAPLDVNAAYERIAKGSDRLTVDDCDPATHTLVLSSGSTGHTWGFLYPIVIHDAPGGCRVEIGCKSKFVQIGPLVTKEHEKTAEELREALGVVPKRLPTAIVHK